ncbi:MAG: hypothetical protein ABI579_05440 [Candidatus Sumerlaeota bacterium]
MNLPPFFVGYAGRMPTNYARIVRMFIVGAALSCIGGVAIMALAQNKLSPGIYEYGKPRPFEGVIYAQPIPMLRTLDPVTHRALIYVLVGATKVAVPADVLKLDGKKVKFEGTLIQRGSQRMIEYSSPETLRILGEPAAPELRPASESLGAMTLRGEVVDTKCFFGAMRPATGKVHRGCAIRCLSGGVPPGLRVQDGDGHETIFLLAGNDGKPLNLDVQLAGLDVEVKGDVELQDNVAVVHAKSIERIVSN